MLLSIFLKLNFRIFFFSLSKWYLCLFVLLDNVNFIRIKYFFRNEIWRKKTISLLRALVEWESRYILSLLGITRTIWRNSKLYISNQIYRKLNNIRKYVAARNSFVLFVLICILKRWNRNLFPFKILNTHISRRELVMTISFPCAILARCQCIKFSIDNRSQIIIHTQKQTMNSASSELNAYSDQAILIATASS